MNLQAHHVRRPVAPDAGTLTLVLGALFVVATGFAYLVSLSADVNPPDWVRVVGLLGVPLGFFGTPVAFVAARHEARARAGLALFAAALVALVVLLVVAG
ncbi:hypothetical protein [Nocardioides marmoribigeumensis]|uniref:Protein-S-isoprenylcysteine O-methyltransferase Ste14 n=1 Tax=Nocardioides marmoribigeumensis TaxID=433649 RepID=A0ABU2BTF2_9ACTN|nr:hypothetical protein [Nocardioides marmoribigeumensis]MDR7361902.1 protein-S-isoprenylcysteine O-methyltransferase Ste14 [Nocardioides marmoribigeumensis]